MTEKYKIDDNGTIIFPDRKETPQTEHDKLMQEYATLEHEVVNSVAHKTDDPEKIARYHELKKILGIPETKDVFAQGIQNVQQKIDKEQNADFWKHVANFKKRNVNN